MVPTPILSASTRVATSWQGAALFNRYFASVRRSIVSIVKDADAANNIEVEAFLAVFHSIRENREPVAEFKSFLATEVRRRSVDYVMSFLPTSLRPTESSEEDANQEALAI